MLAQTLKLIGHKKKRVLSLIRSLPQIYSISATNSMIKTTIIKFNASI